MNRPRVAGTTGGMAQDPNPRKERTMSTKTVPHNGGSHQSPETSPSVVELEAAAHKVKLLDLALCGLVWREECPAEDLLPLQELVGDLTTMLDTWLEPAAAAEPETGHDSA